MISVIVPTYNEADSLPPLVERIGKAMSGHTWELVVVDDGSPDGTAEVANRLSAQHPVWVVRRPGKAGLASAVIAGFKEARGDILVVIDADLSHPPEALPAMLVASADADLVLGSRYVRGGGVEGWPASRRLISRGGCLYARLLLGVGVRDLTGADLRNGILAMAAADVAISNDSGLMHIAAAIGTPTIGIFGPTSPYHWAPLNGLAATVQTKSVLPCQPCHRPVCTMNDHRCMRDIPATEVTEITQRVLAEAGARAAQ